MGQDLPPAPSSRAGRRIAWSGSDQQQRVACARWYSPKAEKMNRR